MTDVDYLEGESIKYVCIAIDTNIYIYDMCSAKLQNLI